MMIHLGIQDALGERLFQAVEKAVWIKGRLDQRPSWDRPQPKAGPGWHPEYEALCVWAWVGSFAPFMPNPHTKLLTLPIGCMSRRNSAWKRGIRRLTTCAGRASSIATR